MTPDIIKAIADVLDAIEGVRAAETGEGECGAWEILCDSGDSLGIALGIDSDATWLEVATALRALARPDVGLPNGWEWDENGGASDGMTGVEATDDNGGGLWIDGRYAPARVVRAVLLRAAGVAS